MKTIDCLAIVVLAHGLLAAAPQATAPGSGAARPTPTPVAPATLTFAGAQVRLRNGITGIERTDQRLLVLWTIVWAHRTGT